MLRKILVKVGSALRSKFSKKVKELENRIKALEEINDRRRTARSHYRNGKKVL